MAKEYGNRRSSRSRSSAPGQFLLVIVTFLLGYLTASFLDIGTVSSWVNTQVLARREARKEPVKPTQQAAIPPKPKFEFYTLLTNEKVPNSQPSTNSAAQPVTAANPAATVAPTAVASASAAGIKSISANAVTTAASQTTLSNVAKVQQPVANKVADTKQVAATTGRGNFLVQVASFKARQDAEQMKGRLTLKGFNVYIVPVSHATKGNWFRVVVGPYSNRALAQQAQVNLAKNERLNGMVTAGG
ncbi:MAG: SPOR domain-containing protein [Legionella sp.]